MPFRRRLSRRALFRSPPPSRDMLMLGPGLAPGLAPGSLAVGEHATRLVVEGRATSAKSWTSFVR